MAKKYLVPGLIYCCSLTCLLIGILTPILVQVVLKAELQDKLQLTKENDWHVWGQAPGKLHALITNEYHMFNITNAQEIMEGGKPSVFEISGYTYQEFDTFLNRSYGDSVVFNLYRYFKKTDKTEWPDNISEDDMITTISVGSLGGWDQIKHFNRPQLMIAGLYTIIAGLEAQVYLIGYSIGIEALLISEHNSNITIYRYANLTQAQVSNIWNDPVYGMGSYISLQYWIIALLENYNNNVFTLQTPLTPTMFTLAKQFGLTNSQLQILFTGHFFDIYEFISVAFFVNYDCTNYTRNGINNTYTCDPIYLASLQWTQSAITLTPPALPPIGPSITVMNSSATGYPELFYYFQVSSSMTKYREYNFTFDTYSSLFVYDRNTGLPKYGQYSLLDVGRMNQFYAMGVSGDFQGISNMLNLSLIQSRILWDYINALTDYTTLQGCFDTGIYDYDNRGISSEIGMGQMGSGPLYNITVYMSNTLLIRITSVYDTIRFQNLNLNCSYVVNASGVPNTFCSDYNFNWSQGTMEFWLQTYWNGAGTPSWIKFQTLSGLNDQQMSSLFSGQSKLVEYLAMFDTEIKAHYACPNAGPVCDPWYFVYMQWGQSYITLNLPGIFSQIDMKNSTSITNYPFFGKDYAGTPNYGPLTGTPEYGAYAINSGKPGLTNYTQIVNLLSFQGLYGLTNMQKYFIHVFAMNSTAIQNDFGIQDVDTFTAYLRYFIDLYFLGGLIRPKSVRDILFTDNDPLINYQINLNPLQGGNPAQTPNITQLAMNRSMEQILAPGRNFSMKINAGKNDLDKLRRYEHIMGEDYVNVPLLTYNGLLPNGSNNMTWVHSNPWNGHVKAKGTDGWMFEPLLSDDDVLYYYFDQGAVMFTLKFDEHTEHIGYHCLRYVVNNDMLVNTTVNPAQDLLYQYGPDGFVNETGLFNGPIFGSKPYFYQAEPALYEMINFQQPQLKTKANCESYLDIEKHAGIVLSGREFIQYNIEIKPDILYPNLGIQNLENYGFKTYLPLCIYDRRFNVPHDKIDEKLSMIKVLFKLRLALQIVGYALAAILGIVGTCICYKRMRPRKLHPNLEEDTLLFKNK